MRLVLHVNELYTLPFSEKPDAPDLASAIPYGVAGSRANRQRFCLPAGKAPIVSGRTSASQAGHHHLVDGWAHAALRSGALSRQVADSLASA
jgi:hypothetical protein